MSMASLFGSHSAKRSHSSITHALLLSGYASSPPRILVEKESIPQNKQEKSRHPAYLVPYVWNYYQTVSAFFFQG
jgi:hypothetical protein